MDQRDKGGRASRSPSGYVTRPGVVTFICVTSFILIVLQIIVLMIFAIGQYDPNNEEYVVAVSVFSFLIAIYASIIFGLWFAKNWARICYVIVFPLLAILEVLIVQNAINFARIIFVAIFCILLFRPKATAYFRGLTLAPIDPASGLELGERKIIPCPSCGKEVYSTLRSCHHCGADLKDDAGPNSAA